MTEFLHCFSKLFSILGITCIYIYLGINRDYSGRLIEILFFYVHNLFDCKESNYIQIATSQNKGFIDIKNILCIHHSCLATVVF